MGVGSWGYQFYGLLYYFGVLGAQNIIALILIVLILKLIISSVKKRIYIILPIYMAICLFLSGSLLNKELNIRLLCACYGHPVIAYTFDADIIDIRSAEVIGPIYMETAYVKTGHYDLHGSRIMPLIEIYRIGPVYYSKIWRNRA